MNKSQLFIFGKSSIYWRQCIHAGSFSFYLQFPFAQKASSTSFIPEVRKNRWYLNTPSLWICRIGMATSQNILYSWQHVRRGELLALTRANTKKRHRARPSHKDADFTNRHSQTCKPNSHINYMLTHNKQTNQVITAIPVALTMPIMPMMDRFLFSDGQRDEEKLFLCTWRELVIRRNAQYISKNKSWECIRKYSTNCWELY